jgi:hypothetical protein
MSKNELLKGPFSSNKLGLVRFCVPNEYCKPILALFGFLLCARAYYLRREKDQLAAAQSVHTTIH